MALNPICLIQDGSGPFMPTVGGVNVSPGDTISIKLLDPSSVVTWFLEVIGTDELSSPPTLTNVNPVTHQVTSPGATVTFPFPSVTGRAIGFKSTVTGTGGPLENTFGTYSLTPYGYRVGFVTEKFEGNATHGWAAKLNPIIRTEGVYTGPQDFKDAVRFATVSALPTYTRTGNVITAIVVGVLPSQDGVTPVLNDSFLLLNGASAVDNGIWVITQLGSGILPFILERRDDCSSSSQVTPGMVVPTGPEGIVNKEKLFILATPDPIVLNITPLTFGIVGSEGSKDHKDAVRFATVSTLPTYTRVSNTITANAVGALPSQDGVTPAPDDSFLLLNGASNADNGIWVVTQVGDGGLPFILNRREDFSNSSQIDPGMVIPTGPEGPVNGKKLFILTTPDPIVLNTTPLVFEAISGGGGVITVRFATITTLPAYIRTGNTITATGLGALPSQDGVTPVLNDVFLLLNGASGADNGVWVITQLGSGGLSFILDRYKDFNDSSQISPGMIISTGPEGIVNKEKLFILATPAPIVLNTTPLIFESVSESENFSLTEITTKRTIPEQQSMLYSDSVVVLDGGDLNVEGVVTPVWTADNFSVNFIPQRSTRVVQENDLMFYNTSMQVDGNLVVDGDIVDGTPYDGYDIAAALASITDQVTIDAVLTTTTATATTIYSYATNLNNHIIAFDLLVEAKSNVTTDTASFVIAAICRRGSGIHTVVVKDIAFMNGPYRDLGATAWVVTFAVPGSGPNINIQVTGDSGESISWRITGKIVEHG